MSASSQIQDAESLPDAAESIAAYVKLRQWINAFDLPGPDSPNAEQAIAGSSGVAVILRLSGRVVGAGTDTSADGFALRRAAGQAVSRALSDQRIRDLLDQQPETFGRELQIELEIAGTKTRLLGRSYQQAVRNLEPGIDGVAMRRGEQIAMRFPAQMLASNSATNLAVIMPALAVDLGLSARPLQELQDNRDVALYRFRTLTLAEPQPNRTPILIYRGQQIVPAESMNTSTMQATADHLVDHLLRSMWQNELLGMHGDYDPVADRYEPLIAGPRDQALAALALSEYAALAGSNSERAAKARSAAKTILQALATSNQQENDSPVSLDGAAAIVLATLSLPGATDDGSVSEMFNAAAARIASTANAEQTIFEQARISASALPGLAMNAAALTTLLSREHEAPVDLSAPAVRRWLDDLWAITPQEKHVALLPWIAVAEIEYARATDGAIEHESDLLRLRNALLDHQLSSASDPIELDLIGGFVLDPDQRPRNLPNASSLPLMMYLAMALQQPQLRRGDVDRDVRPQLRDSITLAMRFLHQLQVRQDAGWTSRNFQRAVGGVRAAPWNADQPLAVQALALLAAIESLRAMTM